MLLASSAAPAFAADRSFCHDYADAAMRQVHTVLGRDRCLRHIDPDSSRWTRSYDRHFGWCRGVSREQADDEREARRMVIDRCSEHRHDRDRDHDGY
jgi:hypothetical protein